MTCASGREAIAQLQARRADLLMVDLRMPDIGGLDVLRAIRDIDPRCQAVLMTGYATVDTAVEAIKLGATDYLSKPLDFARLEQLLAGVRDDLERRRSLLSIEGDVARRLEFCGMIGRSAGDAGAVRHDPAPGAARAHGAGHRRNRHRQGAGRARAARLGPRRERRFVTVNCSAVVETLFESELFGHVRGAFTGATDNKPGLFELADGGHAVPRRDRRAAADASRPSCCACWSWARCSASARSSRARSTSTSSPRPTGTCAPRSAAGRFRSDLFYRLNIVEVRLPPLRERREDIPYLTAAFVRDTARAAAEAARRPDAGRRAAARRRRLGRQRPRAAQRDRARLHPGRRRLHHRAGAVEQHAGRDARAPRARRTRRATAATCW